MYTQHHEQQTIKHCIKITLYRHMVPQSNKLLSLYLEDIAILIFYDVSIINQINPQQETFYQRESKNSVEEKKYYALKVRKFKFNERPLQQFCNNFARISLPFASFDILCS